VIYNSKTHFSFSGGKIAADSCALSAAIFGCDDPAEDEKPLGYAETWGTDNHTYPSKTV
jgi:hypothetical protein